MSADGKQAIVAVVIAATAAIAAGGSAGIGVAGSGVWAENVIRVDTKAIVDGDGALGLSGTTISVTATDSSKINALAGAAAIAAAFSGGASVAVSIGVSLAKNTIANVVEAAIIDADGPAHTSAETSVTLAEGDRVRDLSTGSIYEFLIAGSRPAEPVDRGPIPTRADGS